MQIERFDAKGLAHYSYLLSSQGEAIVIDPRRDVDAYITALQTSKLRLVAILETHIHADYASGARELAAATGAPLYLSAYDEGEIFSYAFPHNAMKDGEEIQAGDLRVVAYHTPGHTPEHLSFLVYERSRCGQPLALFSGDFVFVGSMGRPDLLGEESKRQLAHQLYASVHTRIAGLPDGVLVYPGHGAGSLCGANLSDRPFTTLGYERFCNIFMVDQPEDQFVENVLATVPEFPDYYRRMKALNSAGAPILNGLPGGRELLLDEFSAIRDAGATVIDLRRGEAFGGGHVPGSLNIGAGASFGLWAPWVVPYDRPILLIGDAPAALEDARRALIRVGLDDIRGSLAGGIGTWLESGRHFETIRLVAAEDVVGKQLLDVRAPGEYNRGHAPGALSLPAGDIPKRGAEFAGDQDLYVICAGGYRSALAASLLKAAGATRVANVAGGMAAVERHTRATAGALHA